jgi:hypothetical protein
MSLYRKPKRPLVKGELRMKSWSTLPGLDVAPDSPMWAARCRQYWELQERLFGFRASDFSMAVDNENGFVSTYCVVLEILPGERTADYDRVPVASAQVASMHQ